MKRCSTCDLHKELTEYYRHPKTVDGFMEKCKKCHKAAMKLNRRNNPAVQERERQRAKQPHRRAKARALVVNWRKKFPDKYTALYTLDNAIRGSKVKRGRACIDCGARENVFGIHPDYSKPLEVIWRCALCHHRGRFAETSSSINRDAACNES